MNAACSHPSFWADMCAVCGAPRCESDDAIDDVLSIRHVSSESMEMSFHEAQRVRNEDAARLRRSGKLALVLDLDLTLLHSVELDKTLLDALHVRQLDVHFVAEHKMVTKLRPGVRAFLADVRSTFDLYIYTLGGKAYAAAMRDILDPGGGLFLNVVSRDDSSSATMDVKSLDVLLLEERMTVIVDDTPQVWPDHADNLLRAPRFRFFPRLVDDEEGCDGYLATLARILKNVHADFYARGCGESEIDDEFDDVRDQIRLLSS